MATTVTEKEWKQWNRMEWKGMESNGIESSYLVRMVGMYRSIASSNHMMQHVKKKDGHHCNRKGVETMESNGMEGNGIEWNRIVVSGAHGWHVQVNCFVESYDAARQ